MRRTVTDGTLALDTTTGNTASKSAKITSTSTTGVIGAYQETTISGAAGETLTLSAYMKADGITKKGQTAYDIAIEKQHDEIAKMLLN